MTDCDISGNFVGYNGGGLANYGGVVTLTSCTISGNSSSLTAGGVANLGDGKVVGGTITLTDSTVSGNSAGTNGGGIDNESGTVTVVNTILAGNTAATSGPDAFGTFTSQGHNLIGKTDGSTGWVGSDLTGTIASPLNPLLAPLAYYGGPTETMALEIGSPAITAGVAVSGVTTDQRGFALDSPTPDIGAFQTQPSLVVNTTSDVNSVPLGVMSLRQAVNLADVLGGAETISFDATMFATQQTITLTQGQLELSDTGGAQTITGPTAGVIVSGGGTNRVFQVDSGVTASISGLTVTDGSTSGSGGGLYNDGGIVTLTDITISGNTASADGGGISNAGTLTVSGTTSLTSNSASDGGGMYNTGNLTVSGATFTGNTATASAVTGYGGGGIDSDGGTLVVTSGTFSNNTAPSGGGGAIEASNGGLTVSGGTFTGNVASGGGAIQEAYETMTLSDSTFTSNSGTSFGGALDNGTSDGTVINCTFTTNSAPFGGAINNYNVSDGSLAVSGSTFTDNQATNGQGGAIYNTVGSFHRRERCQLRIHRDPGLVGRRRDLQQPDLWGIRGGPRPDGDLSLLHVHVERGDRGRGAAAARVERGGGGTTRSSGSQLQPSNSSVSVRRWPV